ncbi:hypothetical protein BO70DRAFT_147249 [Aspergillus heteromorphus CBS 117.55]|uniref:Uncharacterized protein n=1 Tax=Aspergillus heteromorphus CBS 117.55 TaxID=1448321 RepID=A0A317V801_9EURO|nr:uncharacterized protein BO70DRAFT_147249 [Aspergillus heteromorphus CBS 117.55]PWY69509.1 hypothetical protein BO70DRAFT_147249 [Aspergillus heteromorphus CBS 117.55]
MAELLRFVYAEKTVGRLFRWRMRQLMLSLLSDPNSPPRLGQPRQSDASLQSCAQWCISSQLYLPHLSSSAHRLLSLLAGGGGFFYICATAKILLP